MGKSKAKQTTPVDKQAKLATYLRLICKDLAEDRGGEKKFTITSQALTEAEMLIDHAIDNIASNTASILKYSGAATIDVKAVRAAQNLAFAGELRKDLAQAGKKALETYEAAIAAQPPPKPKASKPTSMVE